MSAIDNYHIQLLRAHIVHILGWQYGKSMIELTSDNRCEYIGDDFCHEYFLQVNWVCFLVHLGQIAQTYSSPVQLPGQILRMNDLKFQRL